jgi:hypothetical protein
MEIAPRIKILIIHGIIGMKKSTTALQNDVEHKECMTGLLRHRTINPLHTRPYYCFRNKSKTVSVKYRSCVCILPLIAFYIHLKLWRHPILGYYFCIM